MGEYQTNKTNKQISAALDGGLDVPKIKEDLAELLLKVSYTNEKSNIKGVLVEDVYSKDLSLYTSVVSGNPTDIYYRRVEQVGYLESVRIKSAVNGKVKIYKAQIDIDSMTGTSEEIYEVAVTEGEREYQINSAIFIESGEYIGALYGNVPFYYKSGNAGFIRFREGNFIASSVATAEVFRIKGYGGVVKEFNAQTMSNILIDNDNKIKNLNEKREEFVQDVEKLKNNISELDNKIESKADSSFSYGMVYHSTDFSDWFDWDNDSRGSWVRESGAIKPSVNGGYVNDYICGGIYLPIKMQSNFKYIMFDVILWSDTILNIHFARGIKTGSLPNESQFKINVPQAKIQMCALNNRNVTDNVAYEQAFGMDFENGGKFQVVCKRKDQSFSLTLTNTKSGESCTLVHAGDWAVGSMQDMLGFSWGAGALKPIISNVSIHEPKMANYVLIGDSITEGYGMLNGNLDKRYTKLFIKEVPNSFVNAASSATIQDITSRIDSELLKSIPKCLIITIGTNSVTYSMQSFRDNLLYIKNKCEEAGIECIVNHIPMRKDYTEQCISINQAIDELNLCGAKFDVATSVGGNPQNGIDGSLFLEGVHPNVAGHQKLFERMKIDLPFLFA